jgi:phosphate ABC transporter permease protein PstC
MSDPHAHAAPIPSVADAVRVSAAARTSRERLMAGLLLIATVFSGAVILLVIVFVAQAAWPAFAHNGPALLWQPEWDRALEEAWRNPRFWKFGALPLLYGTVLTTSLSLAVVLALGTGCAIFIAELAPPMVRRPVEAVVRLLAGVPSVVFGLVGLGVIVPFIAGRLITPEIAQSFTIVPLDGQSLLAGVIVLSFMILPFYVTVATDSLRAVPRSYRDGGMALGMSHWRSVTRLVIPAAMPGLVAGAVLATARAVGEAIALSMVAGAVAHMPSVSNGLVFFLEPVRTLASAIVENGEGMDVPQVKAALFGLATVLLFLSLALSLLARAAFRWSQRRMGIVADRTV